MITSDRKNKESWRIASDRMDAKQPVYLKREFQSWLPCTMCNLPLWPYRFMDAVRKDQSWLKHVNFQYMAVELILAGGVKYSDDERERIARVGDVFLILRGSNVKMINIDKTNRQKISILIDGPIVNILCDTLGFYEDTLIHLYFPDKLEEQMRNIGAMLQAKTPGTEEQISQATYGLLLMLGREYAATRSPLPETVERTVSFMKSHIADKICIADCSNAAGISETTLRRLFLKQFAVSPNRYFQRLRLKQAAELLTNFPLPVKEIAFKVGFNSPLYFSLAFKAFTGFTPSGYRHNLLKTQKHIR